MMKKTATTLVTLGLMLTLNVAHAAQVPSSFKNITDALLGWLNNGVVASIAGLVGAALGIMFMLGDTKGVMHKIIGLIAGVAIVIAAGSIGSMLVSA